MRLRPLLVLLTALFALASSFPSQAGWLRLQSDHFIVHSRLHETAARRYVEQLEGMHWLGLQVLGVSEPDRRPGPPFEIFMLPSGSSLATIDPALADYAGVYVSCAEGNAAFSRHFSATRGVDVTTVVLQHEYAHRLMFRHAAVRYPAWFVEGFADYMASIRFEGTQAHIGTPMHQLNDTTGWLPMDAVLRWDGAPTKNDGARISGMYAQSWLLTHHLLNEPTFARRLPEYFERLAKGEDALAAFGSVIGIPVAELRHKLSGYYTNGIPVLTLDTTDRPSPVIKVTELGDDADDYLLPWMSFKTCTPPEQRQRMLQRLRDSAAAAKPASPALSMALARAEALQGDAQAAIERLDRMLTADADNAEALYLLGRAWGRRADSLGGEALAQARRNERQSLIKSYRLRKTDAPTLHFLSLALEREGLDQNVVNAARAARQLEPGVVGYAFNEARLDLLADATALAVRALRPVAASTHGGKATLRAARVIAAIEASRPHQEILTLLTAPETKP